MQYVITAQCANFSVMFPDGRRGRQLLFKHQLVPPTATPEEIAHHLSINAIKLVAGQEAAEPPVQEPVTTVDTGGEGGDQESDGDTSNQPDGDGEGDTQQPADNPPADTPNPDADGDEKWADAVTKAQALAAGGKKPDGRHSDLVLAAFLVEKGYDRSAVEKAEKKDLQDLVAGLSG